MQHDTDTAPDRSGYPVFCAGDVGNAHVLAHRHLDRDAARVGRIALGQWLAAHRGTGSQWVHLQWHMMVFELHGGDWWDAYRRMCEHILPAVVDGDAATDGPSALWRLALASPRSHLPWSVVHRAALSRRGQPTNSWVEAHDLLALAGARDRRGLTRWLERAPRGTPVERTLVALAQGLRAWSRREWGAAAANLSEALPGMVEVGGSAAQRELFARIQAQAAGLAGAARPLRNAPWSHASGWSWRAV